MRTLPIFVILSALVCLGWSTPMNPERRLINRPLSHSMFLRKSRAAQQVKGYKQYNYKGSHAATPTLRKGEYMCGQKICKLQPGEVPHNCNGVCQYPIQL